METLVAAEFKISRHVCGGTRKSVMTVKSETYELASVFPLLAAIYYSPSVSLKH